MKKISIMVPCYNEEENVVPLSEALIAMFEKDLPQYDYEILFIDNDSRDTTRVKLRALCENNKKIKAIFNAKNFGQFNSPYYGILQTEGDCTIPVCADFQDPIDVIPRLVAEWEKGYKIVCAVKTSSKENPVMYFLRSCYYKLIKKMSSVDQIEHFTGFGLYDKSFVQVLRDLKDPIPFIRGIVGELGFKRTEIEYTQAQRRAGKTHNNFYTLYDAAMLSFTSYTKIGCVLAPFRRCLRWTQCHCGNYLFYSEINILEQISGRYGSTDYFSQPDQFTPAVLYRTAWGIYFKHEQASDEQTAGSGRRTTQFQTGEAGTGITL